MVQVNQLIVSVLNIDNQRGIRDTLVVSWQIAALVLDNDLLILNIL